MQEANARTGAVCKRINTPLVAQTFAPPAEKKEKKAPEPPTAEKRRQRRKYTRSGSTAKSVQGSRTLLASFPPQGASQLVCETFSKRMHVKLYLLGANRENFTIINHSLVC